MKTTRGPRKAVLELSDGEREQLERWARRPKTAQALALRSRIVLECAGGQSNLEVAQRLGVSAATVGKWRRRFIESRLEGLVDEPRPGRPRTVGDLRVEEVIVQTLESSPPDGGTHWSTRQMAKKVGLSQSTVSRIWRAFGLQPHRVKHWKLSKDPLFQGEGARRGGALPRPARAGAGPLRGREEPDPGAGSHGAPILPVLPGTPARAPPTTTGATAPPACSQPWTSPPGRSSARSTPATGRSSSRGSSRPSTGKCPPSLTST